MHIAVNHKMCTGSYSRICGIVDNVHMANKPHHLREWREHRGKTLVQVAEFLHMTHGTLSRVERGKVPYNQKLLEALAELYICDPADLIMRDPTDSAAIWTLWDHAKPLDRAKIVSVARTITGEGEDDKVA